MSELVLTGPVPRFGAYGKIPAAGDFVRTGLPIAFVERWDAWLQDWLTECARALGAAYDAAYMSAPIWRMTLAPHLAGPQAMTGIVMPSVDRVGRRFPLTIAAAVETAESDMRARHDRDATLFEALETLGLSMLEDGATRETLQAGLAALPESAAEGSASQPERRTCIAGQEPAAAVFSAHVDREVFCLHAAGLPGPRKMLALMSLSAPIWDEARAA